MRRLGLVAALAGMALCACPSFIAQNQPHSRLETLQERRTLLEADLLDAKVAHDGAKRDFAEQLLDDCDMEIATLGLVRILRDRDQAELFNAAFPSGEEPRQIVVRVPSAVVQRAKDEALLANMLNSDVEDSQVGRGMVDYRRRVAIVRLMEKLRREYVDEANRMN